MMASKYDNKIDKGNVNLHSIKISNNEMWIKNEIDNENSSFINIKNIDLKSMTARNIKILLISDQSNTFILAESGEFRENIFSLNKVKYYNFLDENFNNLVRTITTIPLSKNNPEDVDTKADDHAYDALRYMMMVRSLHNASTPYYSSRQMQRYEPTFSEEFGY